MKSKYHNKKIIVDGITFDSRKEARRYKELLLLEKAGAIRDLELQKKFVLIPAQREFCNEVYKKGKNKGKHKPGKLLEKECCYYADFTYFDVEAGKPVVEDAKGFRTEVFKIKKKLMLKEHGIRIKEV